MRLLRSAAAALVFAGAAVAVPVSVPETEPDGFTTPPPQAVGVLGAAGISISGGLDPTSPTGLDPGDRDGYSFTMEAEGPFRATVDDGAGTIYLLAIVEETVDGPELLAAVLGPAPLTLSRPLLEAGPTYRVGVAAFSDGTPTSYLLDLYPENAIPPWTGETCTSFLAESEPNEATLDATPLGWFDRTLCGQGDIAVVSPPDSGIDGDDDTFRFRNVLPVAARLVVDADPGLVDVEVDVLGFVGPAPIFSTSFGGATDVALPTLQPGADYMIRFSARQGTEPLHYSFHLEPVAGPPPGPPEPLELENAMLRFGPDARRSRFSIRGLFEPGVGDTLGSGAELRLFVRGGEADLAEGKTSLDSLGRLRWRAPPGLDGIRRFSFDPYDGVLIARGKGVDLHGDVDPSDPLVEVLLDFGNLRLGGSGDGVFRRKGRVLKFP
jgi:hypothetical protein